MATTTTNFGWDIPQSTDLVKNGATAISTLGQDIDTSMAELKGGTSGQVLSKASNTDMDFVWVTDAGGDITGVTATSPLTGGGTSGSVTVGILDATTSNKGAVQLSTSTSSTSTTLAATASAVKEAYDFAYRPNPSNPIINSAMQVAQRGTTFSSISGATYTLDRWQNFRGAGAVYSVSQQATSDTTNLPFIQYCARVGRPTGNTSLQALYLVQSLESLNSRAFAGKVVTFSFYARKGADFSGSSNILSLELTTGTGTDQNMISGYTGAASPISSTATLTTTWQRFTYVSSTLSSSMTQLGINFNYTPTGTAGAADHFEITGIQVDVGSTALPFRTTGVTYQEELAICQRYYIRFNAGNAYGNVANTGYTSTTTLVNAFVQFPVTLRSIPSSIDQGNLSYLDSLGNGAAVSSPSAAAMGTSYANVAFTTSGAIVGRSCWFRDVAGAGTGYLGFSAEL
jgi:hypothetical protein